MVGFYSVLNIATQVEAPTYRDFYESTQAKSNPTEPDEPVPIG